MDLLAPFIVLILLPNCLLGEFSADIFSQRVAPSTEWFESIDFTASFPVRSRIECYAACRARGEDVCGIAVKHGTQCHMGQIGLTNTFLADPGGEEVVSMSEEALSKTIQGFL